MRSAVFGLSLIVAVALASCAKPEMKPSVVPPSSVAGQTFSIIAVPDTQNYLDYTHQTASGFALDAVDQFQGQMQYIADQSMARGGDVAFVTHLGDVWQHQTIAMDEEHKARGFKAIYNKWFAQEVKVAPDEVTNFEMPSAAAGFRLLAEAGVPFGVVPGNHDYDAMWSAAGWQPVEDVRDVRMTAEALGILHAGGLDNFRSVFGSGSEFFEGKPWYVASHDGGSSSAQVFNAAGYTFLHLALDMSPTDEVIAWAEQVIQKHYGLPTILTTHDYLNAAGERKANAVVDFHRVDPKHNNAQMLWDKFVSQNDQIFMVLSGHQHGQALAVENNLDGNAVYQILADYQDRGQSGVEAGQPLHPMLRRPVGIGDGWLRRMRFDFSADVPTLTVSTYSSHYNVESKKLPTYAQWYRVHEQKAMSDAEFLAADNFRIDLVDFRDRFTVR
ncbi:MAG: hypothetical protein AB8C02_12070 [Halioglobus sp.]